MQRVRAVVVDVDGTLYHQAPVRALMAAELGVFVARRGTPALRAIRVLREFRRVHEELRQLGAASLPLGDLQVDTTAERTGVSRAFVRAVVDEWMVRRPIKYLRRTRRTPVCALLSALKARHVPLGVLSDYPAQAKLEALGLSGLFSTVACTADSTINALKPHPRGFLHVCERLGVDPAQAVYVGDRPDVDAAGARAAGMTCCLVGRGATRSGSGYKEGLNGCRQFQDLERICLSAA